MRTFPHLLSRECPSGDAKADESFSLSLPSPFLPTPQPSALMPSKRVTVRARKTAPPNAKPALLTNSTTPAPTTWRHRDELLRDLVSCCCGWGFGRWLAWPTLWALRLVAVDRVYGMLARAMVPMQPVSGAHTGAITNAFEKAAPMPSRRMFTEVSSAGSEDIFFCVMALIEFSKHTKCIWVKDVSGRSQVSLTLVDRHILLYCDVLVLGTLQERWTFGARTS